MQEVQEGWRRGVAFGGEVDVSEPEHILDTGERIHTWTRGPFDDPDRFAALYEVWRGPLARYCLTRLGDRYEAEDVTQEVFARAWRHRSDFTEEKSFYCWLRVVATNLCTDTLQRRGRSELRAAVDPGVVEESHDRLVEALDRQLVVQAVGNLKSRHRSTLIMREQDGLTYEEIAARTGVTTATVESLLWRARRALKREFLAISRAQCTWAALPAFGAFVFRVGRVGRRGAASVTRAAATVASASPTGRVGGAMLLAICAAAAGVVGTQPEPGPHPARNFTPPAAILAPAVDRPGGRTPAGPIVSLPSTPSAEGSQDQEDPWAGLPASRSSVPPPGTPPVPRGRPAPSGGVGLDVSVPPPSDLASDAAEASLASARSVAIKAGPQLDYVSGAGDARLGVIPKSVLSAAAGPTTLEPPLRP